MGFFIPSQVRQITVLLCRFPSLIRLLSGSLVRGGLVEEGEDLNSTRVGYLVQNPSSGLSSSQV